MMARATTPVTAQIINKLIKKYSTEGRGWNQTPSLYSRRTRRGSRLTDASTSYSFANATPLSMDALSSGMSFSSQPFS